MLADSPPGVLAEITQRSSKARILRDDLIFTTRRYTTSTSRECDCWSCQHMRIAGGDRWEFHCSSVFSIPFSRRGPDHRVDGCSLRWLKTKRRQNTFTPARESASCKLYYGPRNGCRRLGVSTSAQATNENRSRILSS